MLLCELIHAFAAEVPRTVHTLGHLSAHLLSSVREALDADAVVLIGVHVLVACLNLRFVSVYFFLASDIFVRAKQTTLAELVVASAALLVMVRVPKYVVPALGAVV